MGLNGEVLPLIGSESKEAIYLLGNDGHNYELEKKPKGKKVLVDFDSCGAEEGGEPKGKMKVAPWILKNSKKGSGKFAAFGEGVSSIKIKWIPAEELKKVETPKCIASKPGYKIKAFSLAQIPSLKNKVFFVGFESPGAQQAKGSSHGACDDYLIQRLGFLEGETCKTIKESSIDCDGQSSDGTFDKPIGLIEISDDKASERWLVFLAHGGEGHAFMGIPLKGDEVEKDPEIDLYVYDGC